MNMLPIGKNLEISRIILLIIVLTFAYNQLLPHQIILAKEADIDYGRGPVELTLSAHPSDIQAEAKTPQLTSKLPSNSNLPYYETWITATAYTSRVQETDDTPFITASGSTVRDGIVAANFLPFGTEIKIPKLFGNKIFVVEDRMSPKKGYHIDIWFPSRPEALEFGAHLTYIEVVK